MPRKINEAWLRVISSPCIAPPRRGNYCRPRSRGIRTNVLRREAKPHAYQSDQQLSRRSLSLTGPYWARPKWYVTAYRAACGGVEEFRRVALGKLGPRRRHGAPNHVNEAKRPMCVSLSRRVRRGRDVGARRGPELSLRKCASVVEVEKVVSESFTILRD